MAGHCTKPRKAKYNENAERIRIYSQRVLKPSPNSEPSASGVKVSECLDINFRGYNTLDYLSPIIIIF